MANDTAETIQTLVPIAKEIRGMVSSMKAPRAHVLAACALLLGLESGDSPNTELAVSTLVTVIWAGIEMRTGVERKPSGAKRLTELDDEAVKNEAQRIMNVKLLPATRAEPLGPLVLSLASLLVDVARESKWPKEDLVRFVSRLFDGHKSLDGQEESE